MRFYFLIGGMLLAFALRLPAQLNGTYTLGGAGAQFASFGAAVAELSAKGISGNVSFKVRPGLYEERFQITAIPGANANRRVTFESETGDSSSVRVFTNTADAATNWVVSLQNTGQITLRNLSFVAPASGLHGTVLQVNNAANIRVENCGFSGIRSGNPNSDSQTAVLVGGNSSGFQFSNSLIRGGYRGLLFTGISANNALPNGLISGSRFVGAVAQALLVVYVDNLDISNNVIEDHPDQSSVVGLEIYESDNLRVLRNTIRKSSGVGLILNDCRSSGGKRNLVANNMIALGSATAANAGTGIRLSGAWYVDFWYNSLHLFGAGAGQAYGIRLDDGSRLLVLQNNSIDGPPGTILVSEVTGANVFSAFSHCNLWAGGPPPVLPPNSVSLNPNYQSDTDLHLANSSLNNLGTPVAVTDDIDGQLRDGLTPDIGADEYTPSLLSAAVTRFPMLSADSVYCSTQPLSVVLNNSGSVPLTQALIEVFWQGALWTTVNWSGNLASGQSEEVPLGTLPLTPLVPNQVRASVRLPNGLADEFPADDQVVFDKAYAGLSGAYTIGGAGADFPDLSTAFEALRHAGLCGATEMLLRDGVYAEQIFVDAPFKGSSALRPLTLRGESGDSSAVQIVAAGSLAQNSTFRLDGATYVRIQHLTFQQTESLNNNFAALVLRGGHDLWVEHCVIQAPIPGSSAALYASPDSNLTIRHCAISGGETPLSLSGDEIKFNLLLANNKISGGYDDALRMQFWRNVRVENNEISSFSGFSANGMYGLGIRDFEIRNNRVRVWGPQASSGIYLKNCGQYARICTLANNAVAMNLGTGIIAISQGFNLIGCDHIQVLHNSVFHASADADNYAFFMNQSEHMTLLNNVIANGGAGRAFYSFGNTDLVSDYNVFFSKTGALGQTVNDLAGLQTLTGGDQHSVVADPGWAAPEPDSLRLRNPSLENIGTATFILTDLLGAPRQLPNPDPGAYESPVVLASGQAGAAERLLAFPNPLRGQVLGLAGADWAREALVFDLWGRAFAARLEAGVGVVLGDLPAGSYCLRLSDGRGRVGRCFFVKI
ncbi:MAG: right-handed parallel beta-helix repeat-containing protein [Saprospiraceae bacterium]|nr:right-handed parallel beta-helix repeat-containing protein [Saprospiraceae bacterium]